MNKKIIIILILLPITLFAQGNDSIISSKQNKSKYSFAISPTVYIPTEEALNNLSTRFGLTLNCSYKISKDFRISGNLGVIFSKFKVSSITDGRIFYEKTALLLTPGIGLKFYLNEGAARFFLNSHFTFVYINHGKDEINYLVTKNPETAIGFNFGFGTEFPLNKNLDLEINPGLNIYLPNSSEGYLNKTSSFINIDIGLNLTY